MAEQPAEDAADSTGPGSSGLHKGLPRTGIDMVLGWPLPILAALVRPGAQATARPTGLAR